jgi:hypothetical protein
MGDAAKPSDEPRAPFAGDALRGFWNRFRVGDMVSCPVDSAPLALAVDSGAGTYRFVCTHCGVASAWFESGPDGIVLRGFLSAEVPAGGAADE